MSARNVGASERHLDAAYRVSWACMTNPLADHHDLRVEFLAELLGRAGGPLDAPKHTPTGGCLRVGRLPYFPTIRR
jgi:hypothetical protein